jgi:hypothetical protein
MLAGERRSMRELAREKKWRERRSMRELAATEKRHERVGGEREKEEVRELRKSSKPYQG